MPPLSRKASAVTYENVQNVNPLEEYAKQPLCTASARMGWTSWISVKTESTLRSTRGSPPRTVFLVVLFCTSLYLIWLPLIWFFDGRKTARSPPAQSTLAPGLDEIKHLTGTQECNITQRYLYSMPLLAPNISPFCGDRATLLEALNSGSRRDFDSPYIGRGCTYRWFSTPEICMILERFSAISFIGDYLAQSVYTAFTVLLREDLALGGLQQWNMDSQEREYCHCDNQFISSICLHFAIKSSSDIKEAGPKATDPYFCSRTPHVYIPFSTIPASPQAITTFKSYTYQHLDPWKPSPLIFSYAHGSSFSVSTTLMALDEWTTLATAAQRNIPLLFIGPRSATPGTDAEAVLKYYEETAPLARAKNFDVLSFYNLTLEAGMVEESNFGERVALVEVMMIINWLSKVESS